MKMSAVKVSQHKLRRFLELEALVKEHKALKEELKALALAKAEVQPGPLVMQVKTKAGRRTPPWKKVASELAETYLEVVSGEAWADDIISTTKPGSPSQTLIVIDRREVVVD